MSVKIEATIPPRKISVEVSGAVDLREAVAQVLAEYPDARIGKVDGTTVVGLCQKCRSPILYGENFEYDSDKGYTCEPCDGRRFSGVRK